jgi:DNA-binding response OmpR family regulator
MGLQQAALYLILLITSDTKYRTMQNTHILVVDDEAPLRNLLRHTLEHMGYCVSTAASGEEALNLFNNNGFDLVLVDVCMPGMDGFELCAELRKRSDVLIVFITALSNTAEVLYGYDLGADDFITKPFRLHDAMNRIQVLLRRNAVRKEPANLIPAPCEPVIAG